LSRVSPANVNRSAFDFHVTAQYYVPLMIARVTPSRLNGTIRIPASKSHTIRALLIATMAHGTSRILNPLESRDAASCMNACRLLGARITESRDESGRLTELEVEGTGGKLCTPPNVIDVGNSGTTLYLATGIAALAGGWTVFTGDEQIRARPAAPLLNSLSDLGATTFTTRGNESAPFCVRGPLAGGHTTIECPTSQYLSSLLLALPLARGKSTIEVPLLHERPYVEMTLWWLERQGMGYDRNEWSQFSVSGNQSYHAFTEGIPGDFSSATFFFCAAAVTGSTLRFEGLDMSDPQGDKEVLDVLSSMGCTVNQDEDTLVVTGPGGIDGSAVPLTGGRFDLNAIPDALPALAVTACFADSEVRLENVPQARLKETDRIAVMAEELRKMGARVEELSDGLVITPAAASARAPLAGTRVSAHQDHRVAMALAVAALGASGETMIEGADAAEVTYPGFFEQLNQITLK